MRETKEVYLSSIPVEMTLSQLSLLIGLNLPTILYNIGKYDIVTEKRGRERIIGRDETKKLILAITHRMETHDKRAKNPFARKGWYEDKYRKAEVKELFEAVGLTLNDLRNYVLNGTLKKYVVSTKGCLIEEPSIVPASRARKRVLFDKEIVDKIVDKHRKTSVKLTKI